MRNNRFRRMVENEATNGRTYQDFSLYEFFLQGLFVGKSGPIEDSDQEVAKEREERKATRSRGQSNPVEGSQVEVEGSQAKDFLIYKSIRGVI